MTSSAETTAPSVVITGAGGGLGREMALQLDAQHYRVMGTALSRRRWTPCVPPPTGG
jgi:short-subunit dehydrogenase